MIADCWKKDDRGGGDGVVVVVVFAVRLAWYGECCGMMEMRGGSHTPSALRRCQSKELKKLTITTASMALPAALGMLQGRGGGNGEVAVHGSCDDSPLPFLCVAR